MKALLLAAPRARRALLWAGAASAAFPALHALLHPVAALLGGGCP